MTSTTTTKRNIDDTTIDGTNTNKKIKNIPEMSNTWETTLTAEECGVLHKAINDYCINVNVTTKNFFGNGGSISGEVRKDFKTTEFGIARKDGKLLIAPS